MTFPCPISEGRAGCGAGPRQSQRFYRPSPSQRGRPSWPAVMRPPHVSDHTPSHACPTRTESVLASSSRSQVAVLTASAAARLTWDRSSVSVRWRPLLAVAIVTHLVTRLRAGFGFTNWMQTTGAPEDRSTSAGSQRCLRSCMRAVVCPRCCTFCCTELTLKCQGSSARVPSATLAALALASFPLPEVPG